MHFQCIVVEFQGKQEQYQNLWGGLSSGLILEPRQGWRIHIKANDKTRALGHELKQGELSLKQSIAITRNSSIRLNTQRQYIDGTYSNHANLRAPLLINERADQTSNPPHRCCKFRQ